jgi:hypothetical protein
MVRKQCSVKIGSKFLSRDDPNFGRDQLFPSHSTKRLPSVYLHSSDVVGLFCSAYRARQTDSYSHIVDLCPCVAAYLLASHISLLCEAAYQTSLVLYLILEHLLGSPKQD